MSQQSALAPTIDTLSDVAGAWARFVAIAANGTISDGALPPIPHGDRDPQAVADERFFFEHTMRPTTGWRPDIPALRDGAPPIVVGIGESSAGQLCDLTSRALAAGLGIEPTAFPGGHVGFAEDPDAFAARLRAVLGDG